METVVQVIASFAVLLMIIQISHGLPIDTEELANLPPLIFPTDPAKFKSLPAANITALKILQERSSKLLDIHNPKSDAEEISSIASAESPDQLEEQYGSKTFNMQSAVPGFDDDTIVDHPRLQSSHILAIVCGTLALACICGFIGCVLWKRAMQRKYGMRVRLMTEDDFCSTRLGN